MGIEKLVDALEAWAADLLSAGVMISPSINQLFKLVFLT
jgi:hypothetical protein